MYTGWSHTHDQRILIFYLLTLLSSSLWLRIYFGAEIRCSLENHTRFSTIMGWNIYPFFRPKLKRFKNHTLFGAPHTYFPTFHARNSNFGLPPLLAESTNKKTRASVYKELYLLFCLKITKADGHFTHCAPQSFYKAVCVKFTWRTDTDVIAIWLSNYTTCILKEWRQHWVKIYVDEDELF